ncbi:hypothetical protein [Alteribacillus sp. HJP-4]|uniref:hypothetical protein n=1 Tax=Alteribacillus sp. HJP-4 TaxID=2775394 RepID=UPI0035CCE38F
MKNVQAYFFTENDAESAKIKLQSLRVEDMLIDSIPEEADRTILVPIQSSGSGSSGAGPIPAPVNVDSGEKESLFKVSSESRDLNYILQFNVHEEDYSAVMDVLREKNAHLERS